MEKILKIAILGTRGIPARYGGFETFAEQLGMRLVERGHEVTVFCEAGRDALPEYRGIRLVYAPLPKLGLLSTIWFDARCLWQARQGYDFVYMLGYGASPFCVIPRLWGTQVWINMDGLEWARAKWSRLGKIYLRTAEAIAARVATGLIADAAGIQHYLMTTYPGLKRCAVIAYGAPIVETDPPAELLNRFELTPDGYYLVVCRLEPENHVKEILQGFAASATARPVVVVGNHRVDNAYVRSVRAISDPRIHFVGPVYETALLQALRFHSYAYFHGHSVGGTNPSLLEAMGCANAVIAHDNCFNREVLGAAGRYFSTIGELAKLIDDFESSESARAQMQRQAVRRIRECYTWESIAERYSALFLSMGNATSRASVIFAEQDGAQ